MSCIILAISLFIISVIFHIGYCRKTTKTGLHAKVFIFAAMIALGIYVLTMLLPLPGTPFKISAGIIFILLVPIYLCFYVLTQLTSPSKKILLIVAQKDGASHNDILAAVHEEDFIMTRLNDLCTSGCVAKQDGRYTLTSHGNKIAGILNIMQLILGRKAGG